jgi:zinc transport system substrate-binding protein
MPKIRYSLIVATIAVILTVIAGCSSKEDDNPTLTVTLPPQKYILEQIVGDTYTVNSLLAPGTDPETFDPSINHITGLQKSQAYFRIGNIGFEQASLAKITENYPNLPIINSSKGIKLIKGTHDANHGHKKGRNHPEGPEPPEAFDPHVWVTPNNMKIMANNMYETVCQLNPSKKGMYTKRYKKLLLELKILDDSINSILSNSTNRNFAIWHPSLTYFAQDYGLKQLAIEGEGKEIPPSIFKQRLDSLKLIGPKVFFIEKEHDPSQSETLAAQTGIRTETISLTDYDITDNILKIAHAIAR